MTPNKDKNCSYRLGLLWCSWIKPHSGGKQGFKLRPSATIWKEGRKSLWYPSGISLLKNERCEEDGPKDLSIHQMSLMFLPKTGDAALNQVGEKTASLVGEFCKIQGSFLFKSTNQLVSSSLKHFPFFCPLCRDDVPLNFYLQSPLHSAYVTCVLPTSLAPCCFFFSMVWNGTIRKRKSLRQLFPYFFPPCLHLAQGLTHPRVQFGWQSWQTPFLSAYFQTSVSFSPRTPAGQDFTQWGPSIKWAHFMQLSGPCKEKQLVYNVLTSAYSGANSQDKSKCLPLLDVFSIISFYCLATWYSSKYLLL